MNACLIRWCVWDHVKWGESQVVRLPLNLLCRWGGPGSPAPSHCHRGSVCPTMPGLRSAAVGPSWPTTAPVPFINGDVAEIYR